MESTQPDIIIVGGGTAGLLLADELSKDGSLRVHIIEAGKDCSDHPYTQDVSKYTANLGSERDWQYESVPQSGLNGRTFTQSSGKLLGGTSSINGAYYVAPSRAVVNAWFKLGSPAWSSDDFQQACLATVNIHPPQPKLCQENGLEANKATGTGPIQASSNLESHPITKAFFQTVRDLGIPTTSSVFTDHSAVSQPLYLTEDPDTKARSDANTFRRPLEQRSNVTISLNVIVKRVILDGTPPNVIAKGVEVVDGTGKSSTISASQEVILSAGTFGSPKLLELSGIGQPGLLQRHQIPVVIENSHVGERMTNHIMGAVHCELASDPPAVNNPGLQAMAYLPSSNVAGLEDVLQNHVSEAGDDKPYDDQLKKIFLDPKEGSCMHFEGRLGVPNAWSFGVISAVPFSKGSTHVTSSDCNDKPTVDPGFFTHPLDIEVMSRHLKTAAFFSSQTALQRFFKENSESPANASLEEVKDYLRQNAMTAYHSVGTCSMRSRDDGGVVNEQLRVYGTSNLRVVDASVIPMIAHGNPMATVYGIAKLAAGKIKEAVISD